MARGNTLEELIKNLNHDDETPPGSEMYDSEDNYLGSVKSDGSDEEEYSERVLQSMRKAQRTVRTKVLRSRQRDTRLGLQYSTWDLSAPSYLDWLAENGVSD
ncbi:hypothetical protein BDV96DRAFT_654928 [Lophiotrema nucula]|uniref:Uncharacterized protein n=1 Tax=Lophiotrema nucula TaxID=690887 RepID=A0A6A5YJ44_9PLEO|nr:hypothetical protein BDV96DRAFT_654928 [Lophiotrema nucula]